MLRKLIILLLVSGCSLASRAQNKPEHNEVKTRNLASRTENVANQTKILPTITYTGDFFAWEKPPGVTHAIISGCGAGGGGSARAVGSTGNGGAAGPYRLYIVPLTSQRYLIITFSGGLPGKWNSNRTKYNSGLRSRDTIVKPADSGNFQLLFPSGATGAASNFDGQDGVFGRGGAGGDAGKVPNESMDRLRERVGTDSQAYCAGGGGAGIFGKSGGRGGDSIILITPIVNGGPFPNPGPDSWKKEDGLRKTAN